MLICIYFGFLDVRINKRHSFDEVGDMNEYSCTLGKMGRAVYEIGQFEDVPKRFKNLEGFRIVLDTSIRARNFVSDNENYYRRFWVDFDTSYCSQTIDGWTKLNKIEKVKTLKKYKSSYDKKADTIHLENNNKWNLQVWILNNSKDTIGITKTDWLYPVILQAKNFNDIWQPVEYRVFSRCGNSYYLAQFFPGKSNSFVFQIPDRGNYETKLRFKLMSKNRFYYSNEFNGRIDYCEFIEDTTVFSSKLVYATRYKLDSLIDFDENFLVQKK